ncbi:hypothetical protein [Engelhardtia mirabilis]|uniref:Cohesin domain protein n=1 Tax=Engelhardtia mirabilis TaxID=2528011 RepID=A0A518BSN3_9BACT|nr:hypothetical protein Pla133_51060 [Planctomycetes bacterium Pla133]QDV04308.1 hypothetical protein Pla86_51030 [Planctomycetes bacterium Pla86]
MRPSSSRLLVLCCASFLTALSPNPAPLEAAAPQGGASPATILPLRARPTACKPLAPLRLTLTAPEHASGALRFGYSVNPLIDVLDLAVELRLPDGGAVVSHDAVLRGLTLAGDSQRGGAVVAPPTGPGFALEVVAVAHVVDPVIEGGIATLRVTERLEFGELEPDLLGSLRTTASADGSAPLVSRDFAALHRASAGTGEAR